MSLLQMSLTGSMIILVIVALRMLFLNKLPKKLFLTLWWIALLRLLIPVSITSSLSVYSLFPQWVTFAEGIENQPQSLPADFGQQGNWPSHLEILWLTGMVLCAMFFLTAYIRSYIEFRISFPAEEENIRSWKQTHKIWREVSVRWSECAFAPLTYGFIRPVILLPKSAKQDHDEQLLYVLEHEFVHIRRFDMVTKLILTAVLCMHWFNPLVWVMYSLFNRDLEISCDEEVIRHFGEEIKSGYARALICMEEKKSGFATYCNGFGKNAVEERIRAVMKIRKTPMIALVISTVLVIVTFLGFATTAEFTLKEKGEKKDLGETLQEAPEYENQAKDQELERERKELQRQLEEQIEYIATLEGQLNTVKEEQEELIKSVEEQIRKERQK